MSKILVQFFWDCGRQGDLSGTFVTTREELEKAYGKSVNFGEALGKHSEIYGTLDRGDIEILSEDEEFIDKMVAIVGSSLGNNPLDHIDSYEYEDQDEEE